MLNGTQNKRDGYNSSHQNMFLYENRVLLASATNTTLYIVKRQTSILRGINFRAMCCYHSPTCNMLLTSVATLHQAHSLQAL